MTKRKQINAELAAALDEYTLQGATISNTERLRQAEKAAMRFAIYFDAKRREFDALVVAYDYCVNVCVCFHAAEATETEPEDIEYWQAAVAAARDQIDSDNCKH